MRDTGFCVFCRHQADGRIHNCSMTCSAICAWAHGRRTVKCGLACESGSRRSGRRGSGCGRHWALPTSRTRWTRTSPPSTRTTPSPPTCAYSATPAVESSNTSFLRPALARQDSQGTRTLPPERIWKGNEWLSQCDDHLAGTLATWRRTWMRRCSSGSLGALGPLPASRSCGRATRSSAAALATRASLPSWWESQAPASCSSYGAVCCRPQLVHSAAKPLLRHKLSGRCMPPGRLYKMQQMGCEGTPRCLVSA
jgi:hypothetical protein